MEPAIRPARLEDQEAIAAFTRDTFEWGDYVWRVFPDWLGDPQGLLLVASDHGDRPIAMARGVLLSSREAWAQGARVHPEHRRRGIGKRLNDALCQWAASRGAEVMRLAVEDWNEPARRQVLQLGYRPVSAWVVADRSVGRAAVRREERLHPAPPSEVEPAYLAWVNGELARAGRELFPIGWTWRQLRPSDLEAAAHDRSLLEGRSGWAVAARHEDTLAVSWVATTLEDAPGVVDALLDRAADQGATRLELKAPLVEWMVEALRRAGAEVHPLAIFTKPLDPHPASGPVLA